MLIAKLSTGEMAYNDVWHGGFTKNPWNIMEGASGSSAGEQLMAGHDTEATPVHTLCPLIASWVNALEMQWHFSFRLVADSAGGGPGCRVSLCDCRGHGPFCHWH